MLLGPVGGQNGIWVFLGPWICVDRRLILSQGGPAAPGKAFPACRSALSLSWLSSAPSVPEAGQLSMKMSFKHPWQLLCECSPVTHLVLGGDRRGQEGPAGPPLELCSGDVSEGW